MIRRWLLRWLGADMEIRAAFMEGWCMASEIDPALCENMDVDREVYLGLLPKLRTWRSVGEAWVNSDAEELL